MIMIKREDKRGSHVEVIISFVVFVTFLLFLFLLLGPSLGSNREGGTAIKTAEANLVNYLSSELTILTVQLAFEPGTTCVNIRDLVSLGETGLVGGNMSVKSFLGENLDFNWVASGNSLMVENVGVNRFFKIYASEGIKSETTNLNSCEAFPDTDYTSLVKTENYISEQNVLDALAFYKTNYNLFKQDIGLSAEEFGFDFIYGNGTILSTGEIAQTINIYTKKVSIDYFDKDLNMDTGNLIIKIW